MRDVYFGAVPGISQKDFTEQMGLKLADNEGNFLDSPPPITQFLNRVLSLNLDMQERVFTAFEARLERITQDAIARGTLDQGLSNLKAKKTRIVNEQTVFTEKRTGAKTKHVELELTHDAQRITYEQVSKKATEYYHNIRSGKLWAKVGEHSVTDDRGIPRKEFKLVSPAGSVNFVDARQFLRDDVWGEAPIGGVAQEWAKSVAEMPTERHETVHLLSGTLLPIWDRLKGNPQIVRAQTDDGKRMIGRVIPQNAIETVLNGLGLSADKETIFPAAGRGAGQQAVSLNDTVARTSDGTGVSMQDLTPIEQPTASQDVAAGEIRSILTSEIEKLPEQAKTTAQMLLDGKSGQEIGEALD